MSSDFNLRPGLRIVVWGINHWPESTGIAPFNRGMCRYFSGRGHRVSMVSSFAYYPTWRKAAADHRRLFRTEEVDGVPVYRCWHYVPRRPTTASRMLHELSFSVLSFLRVLTLPRADFYLVVSPPLLLGPLAWVASVLKRSRFVFHVQDLQPDAGVALGMVKESHWLTRLLRASARLTYHKAALVSGISPAMMDTFARYGIPPERRCLFPNWVDLGAAAATGEKAEPGRMQSQPNGNRWRKQQGIPEHAFVASYSGNLGRKQGLELLLSAAEHLERKPAGDARPIFIIIAGDGAIRDSLEARLAARPIANLKLLPLLSDADYAALLAASNVCLISQAKGTGSFCLPSKLLTVLLAGRPVAAVADESSELARAVYEGGFGTVTPPEDAAALAATLFSLAGRADELIEYSERGVRWVAQFEAGAVLGKFEDRIQALAWDPPTGSESVSSVPAAVQ